MCRIILLSCILFLACKAHKVDYQYDTIESDEAAGRVLINDGQYRALNRSVTYLRAADYNLTRTAKGNINNELDLTKEANASLRNARKQLKNKRLIRKEKLDIRVESPNCASDYNSFVQHPCYAYNDPKQPQDSVHLEQYELTVLLKKKKSYYKVCLNGEEYYVLRKQE